MAKTRQEDVDPVRELLAVTNSDGADEWDVVFVVVDMGVGGFLSFYSINVR